MAIDLMTANGAEKYAYIRDLLSREMAVVDATWRSLKYGSVNIADHLVSLFDAYRNFCNTGLSNHHEYLTHRGSYIVTKGIISGLANQYMGAVFPPLPIDISGTMFRHPEDTVDAVNKALRSDGVYVFKTRVSQTIVNSVLDQLNRVEVRTDSGIPVIGGYTAGQQYRRIGAEEGGVVGVKEIVDIGTDPLILAAVQSYLGCQPIFNRATSYKTHAAPPGGFAQYDPTDAAQAYHFDLHSFRWLKLFVYLTDVDDTTGPHHFVKTSHVDRPDWVWREGRQSDQEVEDYYGNRIEKVVGPSGTVFLADTSALHKGFEPLRDHRTLLQYDYVDTGFGCDDLIRFDQRVEGAYLYQALARHGGRMSLRYLLRYL